MCWRWQQRVAARRLREMAMTCNRWHRDTDKIGMSCLRGKNAIGCLLRYPHHPSETRKNTHTKKTDVWMAVARHRYDRIEPNGHNGCSPNQYSSISPHPTRPSSPFALGILSLHHSFAFIALSYVKHRGVQKIYTKMDFVVYLRVCVCVCEFVGVTALLWISCKEDEYDGNCAKKIHYH